MTGEYLLTEKVSDIVSAVVDTFMATPRNGTSVLYNCGSFTLMKCDEGTYLNIGDSEDVFEVHGVSLRRPMDADYLCFATANCEVCFPIDTDEDYDSTPFRYTEGDWTDEPDTSDWICDRCCEGFPAPEGKVAGWVRTAYSSGKMGYSIQIHHDACILVDDDVAELCMTDFDESYSVLAVEGYNEDSCMPGLHVVTDEGIIFYFRTKGSEDTTLGGEQ